MAFLDTTTTSSPSSRGENDRFIDLVVDETVIIVEGRQQRGIVGQDIRVQAAAAGERDDPSLLGVHVVFELVVGERPVPFKDDLLDQ